MSADIPGYLFAGAVAAGGIFGYYKAGSVPSLVAGVLFGGALGYGAHEVSRDPENYTFQLVATLLLAALMGFRYYKTKKTMPAGVLCLASIAMIFRISANANSLSSSVST